MLPKIPHPCSRQRIGLLLGPALFLIVLAMPIEGLPFPARSVAASTAWIVCWWMTEAIPIAATSLLPVVLFPALGILDAGAVTAEYGNQIIFLFIGGFLIAIAMEKWNLHLRIALAIIRRIGTSPRRIVGGFMVATAFVSAWISNSATAMMMVPVAAAVIAKASERGGDERFNTALVLSVAYAASIGGVATLIGSPPNLILAGMATMLAGSEITFIQWASFGVPIAIILLALCWLYLVYIAFPLEGPAFSIDISDEIRRLGAITAEERRVLAVFFLAAALWISRVAWGPYLPMVTDSVIAIFGAILLFLIPAGDNKGLLVWEDAVRLPWGIVLLFGCGLAVARGFVATGLEVWIAGQLRFLAGLPALLILLAVILLVIFITEITSNTATATIFIPVAASLAIALGFDPLLLMTAVAVSASLAFMLPVATPPNAIVFASGRVTMQQMFRAGFWMNIAGILVLMAALPFLAP